MATVIGYLLYEARNLGYTRLRRRKTPIIQVGGRLIFRIPEPRSVVISTSNHPIFRWFFIYRINEGYYENWART